MSIVSILGAFLLGSIPGALLVARFSTVDLRRDGSGNPGATNAWRLMGRGAGLATLLIDAGKGWLAAAVVPSLFGETHGWVALGCAAASVLGHVFNPWLGLRGGKGVATSAGVVGALAPRLFVGPLALFVIVFALRRRVSEASIVAAISLPVAAAVDRLLSSPDRVSPGFLLLSIGIALLVLWTHRSNLRRIRTGREPRLEL